MTVILARCLPDNQVEMAGDSGMFEEGSGAYEGVILSPPKVFKCGPAVVGCAGDVEALSWAYHTLTSLLWTTGTREDPIASIVKALYATERPPELATDLSVLVGHGAYVYEAGLMGVSWMVAGYEPGPRQWTSVASIGQASIALGAALTGEVLLDALVMQHRHGDFCRPPFVREVSS
jgi:hypothetical protein